MINIRRCFPLRFELEYEISLIFLTKVNQNNNRLQYMLIN